MSVSTAIAAMRNFPFYGFDQLFNNLVSDKFQMNNQKMINYSTTVKWVRKSKVNQIYCSV